MNDLKMHRITGTNAHLAPGTAGLPIRQTTLWMQFWTQLRSPGVSWPGMAGKVREGFPGKVTAELDLQKKKKNRIFAGRQRRELAGKSQTKAERWHAGQLISMRRFTDEVLDGRQNRHVWKCRKQPQKETRRKEQGSRQKEGGETEGQLSVLHRLPLASIWHISEPGVKRKLLLLQRMSCPVQAGQAALCCWVQAQGLS